MAGAGWSRAGQSSGAPNFCDVLVGWFLYGEADEMAKLAHAPRVAWGWAASAEPFRVLFVGPCPRRHHAARSTAGWDPGSNGYRSCRREPWYRGPAKVTGFGIYYTCTTYVPLPEFLYKYNDDSTIVRVDQLLFFSIGCLVLHLLILLPLCLFVRSTCHHLQATTDFVGMWIAKTYHANVLVDTHVLA